MGIGRRWLSLLTLFAAACVNQPEGSNLPTVNADRVFVFFPTSSSEDGELPGLVRGRGAAGAAPDFAQFVSIRSLPSNTEGEDTLAIVDPTDNSFTFSLVSASGRALEMRAVGEDEQVGPPVFIEVPANFLPAEPHYCCEETKTCHEESKRDREECPVATGASFLCERDEDCGYLGSERLPISREQFSLTKPNANGRVTLSGELDGLPNVLVRLSNLGKSALAGGLSEAEVQLRGLQNPGLRRAMLADEFGRFRFESIPAVGDDELVVQITQLNGYQSPPMAMLTPDPDLVGLDILGLIPLEPLTNGATGPVVVLLSPFGTSGRGICPNDAETDLELCMGGGLSHDMLRFERASALVEPGADQTNQLNPIPFTTDEINYPHNRGIQGNVRSLPVDLFVIIDRSPAARGLNATQFVNAVREYVRYLRQRDRVSLIYADSRPALDAALTTDRDATAAALSELQTNWQSSSTSDSQVMAALQFVVGQSEFLDNGSRRNQRVLIISASQPSGTAVEVQAELDAFLQSRNLVGSSFPVDVVFVDAPRPSEEEDDPDRAAKIQLLQDLTAFTTGVWRPDVPLVELSASLSELRGVQVGSFLMLYEMYIPEATGKVGEVDLRIQMTLGESTASADFIGPIRVANSSN